MPCRVTQDRWVIVKNSDKTWSTGGENGNPLQYSCHENTMNSMKRQKDITPEDESHRSKSETESLSVKSVSLQLMDCSPSTASVHEIFQQEYLSGLSFSSPGHFPDQFQGLDPRSPALQADSLPLSHQGSRSEGVQFATGKEQRTIPYSSRKKMKQLCQSRNNAQLWMCLVVKVKPNTIKNNIA